MIRDVHISHFRELVEQAERDLAGYRRMLILAEQEARVGQVLPDPGMPLREPWPAPPVQGWGVPEVSVGRPPYEDARPLSSSGSFPAIDGGALPPKQEDAFGSFQANHRDDAQTPDALKEQQKWQKA